MLLVAALALAPGLFWLWYFYQKDIYRPEPKRRVLITFLLGMLIVLPVVIIESAATRVLTGLLGGEDSTVFYFMLFFVVVGPVEEFAKYTIVRHWAARSLYFDEPVDGFVYAAAVGLGFATIENMNYMITYGLGIILARWHFSNLGHVFFACIPGYMLGRTTIESARRPRVWVGLLTAMLVHGAFNFSISMGHLWFALLLWLICLLWLRGKLAWAQRVSPFRGRASLLFIRCPKCRHLNRPSNAFCTTCGLNLTPEWKDLPLLCANCERANKRGTTYCLQCGALLLER